MSDTDGHRKSCRAGNCDMCGKGVWRRLDNTRRRREGKREAAVEVSRVVIGAHPDYDPETDCPHGRSGRQGDWCEGDCHPCPLCDLWNDHVDDCPNSPNWPSVWPPEEDQ